MFKCLYPAPDLGPACGDAFLSQGSKFPWEVVLAESLGHLSPNKADQFLFRQQWDPNQVPCWGFQLMAEPRGAPHRVIPKTSHISSRHARKDKKTRFNVLDNSASKDLVCADPIARTQNLRHRGVSPPVLLSLVCAQGAPTTSSQSCCRDVIRITAFWPIKWSDQMITGPCRGKEIPIWLCLGGVT